MKLLFLFTVIFIVLPIYLFMLFKHMDEMIENNPVRFLIEFGLTPFIIIFVSEVAKIKPTENEE